MGYLKQRKLKQAEQTKQLTTVTLLKQKSVINIFNCTSQKGLNFFSLLHPHSRGDMGLIWPLFHFKTRQLKGLPDNLLIDYSFHNNIHTSLQVPQHPTHCYEVVPK
jgi:hypothetical protein